MFETLRNGFRLGSATRRLVFRDKGLLAYPIVMGILSVVEFVILFLGSLVLGGGLAAITGGVTPTLIVGVVAFYLASAFTTTYATIAMLLAFRSFVRGKKMGLREAFAAARPYLTLAFEWALFYTTVVMVLNLIESRFRGVASLIISAVGSLALTVAIMFAVPAIVDNGAGPIKAVETSAKTLVRHFGATFGGIAYTDLYSIAIAFAGIVMIIAGAFSTYLSVFIGIPLIALGIIVFAFGAILGFALSNVFRFVLYEYVNGKPLPREFDEGLIRGSVRTRRQKTAVL